MTVNRVKKTAAALGAEIMVRCCGGMTMVYADAPKGQVFSCSGIHALITSWWGSPSRPTWPDERREGLEDLNERMTSGVEPCNDPECDICH